MSELPCQLYFIARPFLPDSKKSKPTHVLGLDRQNISARSAQLTATMNESDASMMEGIEDYGKGGLVDASDVEKENVRCARSRVNYHSLFADGDAPGILPYGIP